MITKLTYRFIHITGPETEKFLQGQCSIDIPNLDATEFSFGTLNDPKGRMYCLFKACRYKDGVLLGMNETLYDHTLSTLSKYKAFFKCELVEEHLNAYGTMLDSDVSSYPELHALQSQLMTDSFVKNGDSVGLKLPNHSQCEYWIPADISIDADTSIEARSIWLFEQYSSGIPDLTDQTFGKFILQELNLQELGAVSFKKGCYTGQEIIARMKFLGKSKKRMYLFESDDETSIDVLSGIKSKSGQKLGKVICSASAKNRGTACLGVINTEPLDENTMIQIENTDAKFAAVELRYEN